MLGFVKSLNRTELQRWLKQMLILDSFLVATPGANEEDCRFRPLSTGECSFLHALAKPLCDLWGYHEVPTRYHELMIEKQIGCIEPVVHTVFRPLQELSNVSLLTSPDRLTEAAQSVSAFFHSWWEQSQIEGCHSLEGSEHAENASVLLRHFIVKNEEPIFKRLVLQPIDGLSSPVFRAIVVAARVLTLVANKHFVEADLLNNAMTRELRQSCLKSV